MIKNLFMKQTRMHDAMIFHWFQNWIKQRVINTISNVFSKPRIQCLSR